MTDQEPAVEPTDAVPTPFVGLIDDTSALPVNGPGPLAASLVFGQGVAGPAGAALGRLTVLDSQLPLLRGSTAPVHVALSGGAGQIAGPAGLSQRLGLTLTALTVALRDLDDLAANARRVIAAVDGARASGALAEEVAVHVEIPADASEWGWSAALDEVAGAEFALTLRLGSAFGGPVPDALVVARWIE